MPIDRSPTLVVVSSEEDADTLRRAGCHALSLATEDALAHVRQAQPQAVLIGPTPERLALIRALADPPGPHLIALTDAGADPDELADCLEAGACAVWQRGLPARLLLAQLAALPTPPRAASLHAMIEQIEGGVLTIDRAFTITYVNPHGAKLLHGAADHIIGKYVWDEYPTARGTIAQRCYEAAMYERVPQRFEYRDEVLDLWLEVRVYPSEEGICVLFFDVTERRHAEQQLHLLKACVERVNDLIIIAEAEPIDAPGPRILYVNPAFERVTGFAAAEILGKTPRILQGPNTQRDALGRIREALAAWQPVREEVLNYTKDGRELWLELDIAPVADERGWFTHWVAIERDITERKRAEAHRMRTQRVEAIAALTSGVVHDLNNVLTPILSIAPLLRADEHDPERVQDLATIEACAQRGAQLLRQLLMFGRVSRHATRVVLSARALAQEAIDLARATFPKDITFALHSHEPHWPISGDPAQLLQLLTNLLINARDAMPDGGQITLRIDNLHERPTAVHLPAPGPYVVIQVEDNGVGIPPELHERIFEPFFTTKDSARGTGLGLSTCQAIVHHHHGAIHLDSAPGHGARFTIYLPASQPAPSGQGELLLVVEDEPALRDLLERALTHHGYKVLAAPDGQRALALYHDAAAPIALVLTDMAMPHLDGAGLIRALHALDPALPILATSGAPLAPHITGLRAFIPKPYDVESILHAIRAALDAPTSARR